jgi:diphthine-ammonia ligase
LENTEVVITDPEPYPVAYLRVAGGRLVKKEGWARPNVEELREMLGLSEEDGMEGLDEDSRDLLGDLKREVEQNLSSRLSGLSVSASTSTTSDHPQDDEVRFNKREQWFAASVNGITQGDESIGDELARCFDSIQGRFLPLQPIQFRS